MNVQDFIDRQPVVPFQWLILAMCFLVTAIDGLDTAAIGFIAPALRDEWGLSPAQLNPVLGAALIGLMLGAFIAGPLADRFGRKTVLMASVLCFGGFSLAAAFSNDLASLTVLRFLTGLGLGGAMPNAITLTSEYCPTRRRSLMVTSMFCGFTLGSALGGVVAAHMVPAFGWRSVLLLGGLLPMSCLPLLYWLLPESARFLVQQGAPSNRIAGILRRIGPLPTNWNGSFHIHRDEPGRPSHSPIRLILSGQLKTGTMLLWLIFFMSLLIIYMMTNWLPMLIKDTGLNLSQAAMISATFQLGGTLGAVCLGGAMDRFNQHRVLVFAYIGGALCLFAIGQFYRDYSLLILCVAGMGFCISGSQVGANALAAGFYPTASRATGVSWAHGVGRIGSVVGTLGGGALLSLSLHFDTIFSLLMLPALIAAAAIFLKGLHYSPSPATPTWPHCNHGPAMQLYSFFNSSTSYRVRIAIAIKGLAYECLPVNLRTGEQRRPSPIGGVPVLIDDDCQRLTQSLAIIDRLDALAPLPRLIPTEASLRAQVLEAANLIACDIHPLNNVRVLGYLQRELGATAEQKSAWYAHWVAEGLEALEALLQRHATGPYCFGEAPTLADCCLVPQVTNAQRNGCPLDAYPRVMQVFHHCQAQGAFRLAAPEQQPDIID